MKTRVTVRLAIIANRSPRDSSSRDAIREVDQMLDGLSGMCKH